MTSTPFHELDQYVAIPRVSGLVLSPDGSRLVTERRDARCQVDQVRDRAVGGGPDRGEARTAADPERQGRGQRRVHAGRGPAVHQRAAGPGRQGGRRRARPGAVADAARRCGGARGRGPGGGAGRRRRWHGTPTSCWSARTCCPVRPTRRPTRSCARPARRRRSRRSCTTATRSGSGTTTWARSRRTVRRGHRHRRRRAPGRRQGPAADAHGRDAGCAVGAGRAGGRDQPGRAHGGDRLEPAARARVAAGPAGRGRRGVGRAPGARRRPGADLWSPGDLAGRALGRLRAARRCRRRTRPRASRCSWSRWPAASRGRSSRAGTAGRSTRCGCPTARGLLVSADDDGRGAGVPGRPRRRTRSRG